MPGDGAVARRTRHVVALLKAGLRLPPGPLLELVRRLGEPTADLTEMTTLLRRVPVLRSNMRALMQASPFKEHRGALPDAEFVVLLGSEQLRFLVLGCSLAYFAEGYVAPEQMREFWQHSIHTALISESLARQYQPELAEQAYFAGLLHDLGRLPLMMAAQGGEAAEPRNLLHSKPAWERAHFGVDHTEVSRWIARSWDFPAWLSEVLEHHHTTATVTEVAALVSIVAAAEMWDRHGFEKDSLRFSPSKISCSLADSRPSWN
jgi:putative nucleotidyltransferase with HDIG domain